MDKAELITRRAAVKRAAMVLGGALSAPTLAAAFADHAGWKVAAGWTPLLLAAPDTALVATIAEHILPATDTPGARAAGVHRFIDAMLAHHYGAEERDRFLAGLHGVDVRAQRAHKKKFLACTSREQVALLTEMDRAAYAKGGAVVKEEKKQGAPPQNPEVGPSSGTPTLGQPTVGDVDVPEAVQKEMSSGWFFRRMKELTLVGYYTSEVGATRELHVNPMGRWKGDMPYAEAGRSWS
ncbi:MAG: lactose 3-dehydrogenase subunit gamma LacC [Gemmatimonadaceae bacterium]